MNRILTKTAATKIGESITVMGWVDTKRDHGKITFIDLRDRSGILQVVGAKELKQVHSEDVLAITGIVKERPEATVNDKIPTGKVELEAKEVIVLNAAKTLPLPIDSAGHDIDEELRLKYRYLDLRRKRLQRNLRLRSEFVDRARQYLYKNDFVEIETPMLTKSTPEGSRDFLVPSRLNSGSFYALPQSPQQYKQLLMVAGFERYFQLARCIRDEDLRADRGFEHTQIDIEMSFVEQQDVMALIESMIISLYESFGLTLTNKPFPVINYHDALKQYGADKFDMRTEEQKKRGEFAFAWVVNFPFFEKTEEGGWTFSHNPFSSPLKEHEEWLLKQESIDKIITAQYDLICNGYEVGGGSIRSHNPEVLKTVFQIMGYKPKTIEEQFGHMLEAFTFGAPPHGGIALGVDRHIMLMTNEEAIREVQAFPMTGKGNTSVMNAPSPVSEAQLTELGIFLKKKTFASPFHHILDLLKTAKVQYQLIEHEPVFTSADSAKVRGTTEHQGAKALVLQAGDELVLYVLPADEKADLESIAEKMGVKRVAMASKDTVESKTGLGVGSIPPFGSVIGLKTYLAKSLADNAEIAFNAARHDRSIKMRYSDFVKIEKPELLK